MKVDQPPSMILTMAAQVSRYTLKDENRLTRFLIRVVVVADAGEVFADEAAAYK